MSRFENVPKLNESAKALFLTTAIGLGAAACGGDSAPVLPEGAKMPADYEFVVLIGEDNDYEVTIYTDTKPELSAEAGLAKLVIDGPSFCPPARKKYGVEIKQAFADERENYCLGSGFYPRYEATSSDGRIVVFPTASLLDQYS